MPAYFTFALKEELERLEIEKSSIVNPYSLWNSQLPRDSYIILGGDRKTGEPANKEAYAKLTKDKRYEKFELYSGN